ncbi:hypothetical protein HOY80DRAFT_261544 [Tuber brumale]|nr:hypothetical protein HOY80DRAFT_261544 [Tuber brumale]
MFEITLHSLLLLLLLSLSLLLLLSLSSLLLPSSSSSSFIYFTSFSFSTPPDMIRARKCVPAPSGPDRFSDSTRERQMSPPQAIYDSFLASIKHHIVLRADSPLPFVSSPLTHRTSTVPDAFQETFLFKIFPPVLLPFAFAPDA